ncbi:hypothetical protein Q7P37_001017 [Cladosporium fusiforme]
MHSHITVHAAATNLEWRSLTESRLSTQPQRCACGNTPGASALRSTAEVAGVGNLSRLLRAHQGLPTLPQRRLCKLEDAETARARSCKAVIAVESKASPKLTCSHGLERLPSRHTDVTAWRCHAVGQINGRHARLGRGYLGPPTGESPDRRGRREEFFARCVRKFAFDNDGTYLSTCDGAAAVPPEILGLWTAPSCQVQRFSDWPVDGRDSGFAVKVLSSHVLDWPNCGHAQLARRTYYTNVRHTHTLSPFNATNTHSTIMYTAGWLLSSLFALTATAIPIDNSNSLSRRSDDTFNIEIQNNCPSTKHFALYKVTSIFEMLSGSDDSVTLSTNETQTITAPYKDIGLRLSGHAEWGAAGQWKAQALAEFGYSNWSGQDGTAYDVSLMDGCEKDIGLAIYPQTDSDDCPKKSCYPGSCDASQGWTNPDQVDDGSPADTVCYHGKTDFKVVFCP